MDAATIAARRRNKESRPKTRPRSSSCPDLTSIKVVAVIRLRGTWVARMRRRKIMITVMKMIKIVRVLRKIMIKMLTSIKLVSLMRLMSQC